MYSAEEYKQVKNHNQYRLKELIRTSYILGINLNEQTTLRWLKIVNILLLIISFIGIYPRLLMLQHADGDIPLIAEKAIKLCVYISVSVSIITLQAVTTMLQTTTGMVKLIYYIFMQHKFHALLEKAKTHEHLQCIEIFLTDMPIKIQLKQEIDKIMETIWMESRRQLLSCLITCSCILSNYFFYAVFANLYHQIQGTPDYVYILPFTGYPMFLDKGMPSFYYAFEIFVGGCSLLAAGMCSVSFHCIFMILCKHACGLVKVLKILLVRSNSPLVPKKRRDEYLRYCVIQHQRTLAYIDEINEIFKHITLSHFLHSLVIYGFVLFEMNFGLEANKVVLIRMIMYICAALTVDSMYYVNGQFLATELEGIPAACYDCEWYNESKDFKKILQMIIMRSNKDFCFQISWFGVMSLTTLLGILRASFSYFLILRDLTTEEE